MIPTLPFEISVQTMEAEEVTNILTVSGADWLGVHQGIRLKT